MRNVYARFYFGLRRFLGHNPRLLFLARIGRAYFILGPLRNAFIEYYQSFSNNEQLPPDSSALFSEVDVDKLVQEIEDRGYAELGNLPAEDVEQIRAYCEKNKQVEYWNPHKTCEIVDHISRNRTIVSIVRKYLGAEPILWLTQLRWTFASADNQVNLHASRSRKHSQYDLHDFHCDMHDFRSLTVFVY